MRILIFTPSNNNVKYVLWNYEVILKKKKQLYLEI